MKVSRQTCGDLKTTKEIYEHIHRINNITKLKIKTKSLKTLLIEGFDTEQIFQQIELQNENALSHFNKIINFIDGPKYVEREQEDSGVSDSENSKNIMYDDFFDPPESEDENLMQDEKDSIEESEDDELSFNESTEMPDETPDPSAENNENQILKTAFEIEQEKIKKAISNYEDALIQKPEWQLTGEVTATARPKDSLLHQETDFDLNAKPVLIEDNVLNEKIEKAVKTIIKNKAFSDGERKFKPNDITSYQKEILVEQTKSKKSLAAVYEEEYIKKKYGEQEEDDPKHIEIQKMMDSLFPELQALFCHVPKPALPDIKIVSHLPAITVEEVAPTSVSDMTLLAPEEVKKKSGLIKGKTEKTDTDRKRERRKKKILQRKKFKQTEENDEKSQTGKTRRLEKLNTLKKLKQHRNTKIAGMESDKIKSSKDFFSRLQESVDAFHIQKRRKN